MEHLVNQPRDLINVYDLIILYCSLRFESFVDHDEADLSIAVHVCILLGGNLHLQLSDPLAVEDWHQNSQYHQDSGRNLLHCCCCCLLSNKVTQSQIFFCLFARLDDTVTARWDFPFSCFFSCWIFLISGMYCIVLVLVY